ncbi:hypothetical protein K8I61_17685 [bacterium]|nr:hypothetical protein [bacterium]
MPRFLIAILLAAFFASAVAGCSCGDDDDDDDDSTDDDADDDDDGDDDSADDDAGDDDLDDDDSDDDAGDDDVDDDFDDDTADDDTADDDTSDDDTGDDDTGDDDTGDDDTGDDDTGDDDTVSDGPLFPMDPCIGDPPDPATPGPFATTAMEYGHDGDPDKRTTNVQPYVFVLDFYVRFGRGIKPTAVPLHAVGYYPNGAGPFPVVLVVHGNHDPAEFSYPGYDYLTSHLATHGYIAFSVEEDFLNGASGENDARGIVLLRHLQLFREWNETPTHPLYQKIDLSRIGLAGHSRGGEAVVAAQDFNTTLHNPSDPLHDFDFDIRALFAIAPVDGQILFQNFVPRDVNYAIMHGSNDGDVSDFQGHATYDRALPVGEETTAAKALAFVYGANHAHWNTVWSAVGDPYPPSFSDPAPLSGPDQRAIGLNFITSWFLASFDGETCYRNFFAGETTYGSLPGTIVMNQQFQGPERMWFDHYEEDANKTSGSLAGATNSATTSIWTESPLYPGSSRGVSAGWTSASEYRVDLPALDASADDFDALVFRAATVYEVADNYNTFDAAQDFSVRVVVDGVEQPAVPVSDYATLTYPARVKYGASDGSKTVLNTVRIPLADLSASPIVGTDIEAVIFEFDVNPKGLVSFDDIQLATP